LTGRAHQRGFTLIEVMLAMTITAILLGSMGSLVVLTSKAIPGKGGAADESTQAEQRGIEVKVADRDSDGKLEEVRYEWSGSPGDPVERVYNGVHTSYNFPVSDLKLSYTVATSTTSGPSTVSTSGELFVSGWNGALLNQSRDPETGKPVAQHVVASLPAGARTWTITRIRYMAMQDLLAATGVTEVQIRTVAPDGTPTGGIIASATVAESSLATLLHGWRAVSFTDVPALPADREIAIVFVCLSGCPSGNLAYVPVGAPRPVPMQMYNGTSWAPVFNGVIPHEVYAKATTVTANVTSSRNLQRVTVDLKTKSLSTPLRSSFALCNAPEVQ
jgi:prepilin-type N-terminal cleavage/methylation domain-containing protein